MTLPKTLLTIMGDSKILGRMIVRKKLKPLGEWMRTLRFSDIMGIFKQLFSGPTRMIENKTPEEWKVPMYISL
ncbi:hypothetical protein ACFQDF_30960 [Ectobacillus funiculus]|uniref:Uncharacterized protein n=1 Tax=Ectobacillus funiculus TaxID=137993 RepID=A0ABV5WCQ3_9BACI